MDSTITQADPMETVIPGRTAPAAEQPADEEAAALEQDLQRFAVWRGQRGDPRPGRNRTRRTPLPGELWTAALTHVARLGLGPVARLFRLDPAKLRRKAEENGLPLPPRRKRQPVERPGENPRARGTMTPGGAADGFLEFPMAWLGGVSQPAADTAGSAGGTALVLERGDGAVLRLAGAWPDRRALRLVITLFLGRA